MNHRQKYSTNLAFAGDLRIPDPFRLLMHQALTYVVRLIKHASYFVDLP